jgi:3-hydroxypropanoate dehydrogenase
LLDRPGLDAAGRALLFTEARTANTFAPTPVTDDELAEIWELAKWPPTAANIQPLRVLYLRTPIGKARLLPSMSEGNRDKTASAPAVAVLAVDTAFTSTSRRCSRSGRASGRPTRRTRRCAT